MRLPAVLCAVAPALLLATAVHAAPPSPIIPELFPFPGAVTDPTSAASAATALADRWLGEEPFWNPAVAPTRMAMVSGMVLRVNRQDLRADNRNYDEQPAFFDLASAWGGMPVGTVTVVGYAFQPVLRHEDNAFTRGNLSGPTPPAIVQSYSSAREMRAGVAASLGIGAARAGVGAEWTYRTDHYETDVQSGAPDEGQRVTEFSGGAPSGQLGVQMDFGGRDRPVVSVGAGARYLPELTVEGEEQWDLVSGAGSASFSARREAGLEAGLSVRWSVTEAFELRAGGGGRTAQEWQGFDVTSGAGSSWGLALKYRDPREAWSVRFGVGRENQDDVPEPSAGVIGLGIGWILDQTIVELGVVRRGFERAGQPTSFDDRVVLSVGFDL